MKVTFKTLKQQTFFFEFEESVKIEDVKNKIEEDKGEDYKASNLKLIYSGKVMDDDKTLKDYNVTEKGFVVIMNRVNRAPAKEPPKTTAASSSESKPIDKKPETIKEETPTKKESEPAPPNVPDAGANFMGAKYEENVATIVNMGFTKEKAQQALRASFNNPERAIEYLINDNIPQIDDDVPPIRPSNESGGGAGGQDRPADAQDPIAVLSRMPQFLQMREMVRQNPQLLSELVKQILETNPELFALISENEQRFLEFINAPDENEGDTGEEESDVPRANPGQVVLQMTHEEKEAIDRLKALGFPENMVVQAYYACDKNENAAAEFLFSDQNDDDMI